MLGINPTAGASKLVGQRRGRSTPAVLIPSYGCRCINDEWTAWVPPWGSRGDTLPNWFRCTSHWGMVWSWSAPRSSHVWLSLRVGPTLSCFPWTSLDTPLTPVTVTSFQPPIGFATMGQVPTRPVTCETKGEKWRFTQGNGRRPKLMTLVDFTEP